MGHRRLGVCLVLLAFALCVEPVLADVNNANSVGEKLTKGQGEMCNRTNGAATLLHSLPEEFRGPAMALVEKHGETMQKLVEKKTGLSAEDFLSALPVGALESYGKKKKNLEVKAPDGDKKAPTSSSASFDGTVAFLETSVDPTKCVYLGVLATICTLLSTYAILNAFNFLAYFRKVTNVEGEMSFREFSDLAESLYGDGGEERDAIRWTLPPSGFTPEERKLYQDFLMGKEIGEQYRERFEKRKEAEKKAYSDFLADTMYIKAPHDKKYFVKVLLPAIIYLVLHLSTYVTAYNLGR